MGTGKKPCGCSLGSFGVHDWRCGSDRLDLILGEYRRGYLDFTEGRRDKPPSIEELPESLRGQARRIAEDIESTKERKWPK